MPTVNGINSDTFGRDDVIRAFTVDQFFGQVSRQATVYDGLDGSDASMALSATQGTVLYELVSQLTVQPTDTISVSASDVTSSRSLVAVDFDGSLRRVTSAATITVPTVASMGLSSTPGRLRTITFMSLAALTFAAAPGVTINGIPGSALVTPIGGAAALYGKYTLTQTGVGANNWALQ